MDWVEVILYGLLGGFLGGVLILFAICTVRVLFYRRCRACGRARALRRVPGTRREGFVRFRCKYCGTKQWGVIEARSDEIGTLVGP